MKLAKQSTFHGSYTHFIPHKTSKCYTGFGLQQILTVSKQLHKSVLLLYNILFKVPSLQQLQEFRLLPKENFPGSETRLSG
jgi:hypothetical protein